MLRVAVKSVLARRFRLVSTGLAVILGVAFMAGGLVLTDTISETFDDLFADVTAGTDAVVRSAEVFESDFGERVRARVPRDLVDTVAAVDGVAVAEPTILGQARLIGRDGKPVGNPEMGPPTFGGNWGSEPALNPFQLVEGRAPRADDEVVVNRGAAKDGDLGIGDEAQVVTRTGVHTVTIVGIATFGDADSAGGSTFVGFTDRAAEHLVAEPGRYDGIWVEAEPGVSQEEVTANIAAALPAEYEAITGEQLTQENQDDIREGLSFFDTFITVFTTISLFVGAFIIYNTFSILVAQRRREMALLRAVGATGRQVLGGLLLEAVTVGVIASLIGLVAGIGVATLLKLMLNGLGLDIPSSGVVVTAGTIQGSIVVGTLVTVLAAWLPARRAAKIPPLAALREDAVDSATVNPWRVVIAFVVTGLGVALLVAGLAGDGDLAMVGLGALVTFIGVTIMGPVVARPFARVVGAPLARGRGVAGRLARENAMRNPQRTARTASALLIGVTLVGFIAIVTSSVKESFERIVNEQFTGDFVIGTGGLGGFSGLPPELAERLRDLDEVDQVAALRTTTARFDGDDTTIAGIDAVAGGAIFDIGVVEGSLEDLGDDGIAAYTEHAEDEGWEIGTELEVVFPETGARTLRVAALYENPEVAGPWFVGLPVIASSGADQFDANVFVSIADGVDFDEARAAVQRITDEYPTAELQDREEFVDSAGAFIDQLVALIYVFLALSVFIALVGIANTLALAVIERTRELGLLRAVGQTRRQLRAMVRGEAVTVALFGTLCGLGLGLFLGWAMVEALADEGFTSFALPTGQLAVIVGLGAVVGVLAALRPARRAARLDVLEAIATD